MVTPLTFPALVKRLVKGAELTFAEGDQNLTNIQEFCVALANLMANSLNPDGTLVAGSVGAAAIQAGAFGISSINPAALYSIIPMGQDKGTVNAYAISTLGPQPGNNLIVSAPSYDTNGNYTLNGLTQNSSYVWTKNANDLSLVVDENTTLTASGIFQATQTSAVLKGSPGALVTATVFQAAAVASYQNGQIYFIYTQNANTGASTLNVNGLGAIPILSGNAPLTSGMIGAGSVFCAIYENGVFILFSGSGTSGGSATASTATNYTFEGTTKFNSGYLAVPANSGAGGTLLVAHGLQQVPDSVQVSLIKVAADSTSVMIGETVPAGMFTIGGGLAFSISWDSTAITVTEIAGAGPNLFGTAITPSSWVLVVTATKQSSVNNLVFPALTYSLPGPEGAFSYGTNMVMFNYTGAKTVTNVLDMTTNLLKSLAAASPGGAYPQGINGSLFTRASGEIDFVFCATTGVYTIPAVNPLASIVPPYVTYNNSGIYDLTVVSGTVYNWTAGTNDTSYSLDGGVTFITTASFTGPAGGLIVLKGTANGSVTASVLVASATWGAVRTGLDANLVPIVVPFVTVAGLYAYSLFFNYKPAWIVEAAGAITDCYAVASSNLISSYATGFAATASAIAASTTAYSGSALNAVAMIHITGSGITNVGTPFDFTNVAINGVSTGDYAAWYAAGDNPTLLLFQYNPISKRMYIVTSRIGCIHIFKITGGSYGTNGNDISAFWADASGRYGNLSYVKSVSLAGGGDAFVNTNRCHMVIEWDMVTGLEKSITFTRDGSGSVSRVPWVE